MIGDPVEKYLEGARYPARVEDLVDLAQRNAAPDELIQKLRGAGRDEFESADQVRAVIG